MHALTRALHSLRGAALLGGLVAVLVPGVLAASGGEGAGAVTATFLFLALILLAAKAGALVERWGQPSVLGELCVGVLFGNIALFTGVQFFEGIRDDVVIAFLAELGVVILLFQIGLESNVKEMTRVGVRALLVAVVGVVVPFALGTWVVGPLLLPGLPPITYLFLGAALTATSVGITARVFRDLGKLQSKESQIVLGAAVIDDIIGLIILAVVSAIATVGSISTGSVLLIIFKAVGFLVAAIFLGHYAAPYVGRAFSAIQQGVGMKFTLAFSFGLIFAYLAHHIGLAPIVGAFAAGLILDPVAFRSFKRPEVNDELDEICKHCNEDTRKEIEVVMEHQSTRHVEHLIEPVAYLVVPVFFVITGMQVDLATFLDSSILLTALGITVVAFLGKLVAGLVAGPGTNRWIVGLGMVPRGEVGLIFATIGAGLGVVSDSVFSVIVIMVILTTLLTPPLLTVLLKKS